MSVDRRMFVARCVLAVASALGCAMGPAHAEKWWNADWPYRVRIVCQPGEGDVAVVRVWLGGHTTPDGRDLRLIDVDGHPRPFEILYHDPQLSTLIQFEVPHDKLLATRLYFGNEKAEPIKTKNPGFTDYRTQWDAWKKNETEREAALKRRAPLEKRLEEVRAALAKAEAAGRPESQPARMRERIAELEERLAKITVPESQPEPRSSPAWYPQRGLLLQVYRKPREEHPKTLTDLRRMIMVGLQEGADFRAAISDGFNPFGVSDNYISVYDGYLRIDKAGEYGFCTVSDDGSWLGINDQTVAAWPGAHGYGDGAHGEHNGTITLKPGVAHVQYFQEEGTGGQMAFVGWKPPGEERFWSIPEDQWVSVRRARDNLYEARDKPVLAIATAETASSYWIRDSEDLQVTMEQFASRAHSRDADITDARWSFGDGLSDAGEKVQHAYFRLGRPTVTLTVTDAQGRSDSVTIAPNIYPIDFVARNRRYGRESDYIDATRDYDVEKLDPNDLAMYIQFCHNLELWPQHVRAVLAYLQRVPDVPDAAALGLAGAESSLRPQAYNARLADELLRKALPAAKGEREKCVIVLRAAEVAGWHLDNVAEARRLYRSLRDALRGQTGKEYVQIRRATAIGLADAALLAGEYDEAERLYREIEKSGGKDTTEAEKLAKIGSYAYTVDDLLARGEYDWALQTIDKWEWEFPLQKLEGYTFFLRGKVLFVEKPGELALRYLDLAERVAPRAVHVPETIWLRANCYLALGRKDDALKELKRITADFTSTEFLEKAVAKIRECEPPPKDTGQ